VKVVQSFDGQFILNLVGPKNPVVFGLVKIRIPGHIED